MPETTEPISTLNKFGAAKQGEYTRILSDRILHTLSTEEALQLAA